VGHVVKICFTIVIFALGPSKSVAQERRENFAIGHAQFPVSRRILLGPTRIDFNQFIQRVKGQEVRSGLALVEPITSHLFALMPFCVRQEGLPYLWLRRDP
jgi:hypothetical protein